MRAAGQQEPAERVLDSPVFERDQRKSTSTDKETESEPEVSVCNAE